jgi:hypothetical protein
MQNYYSHWQIGKEEKEFTLPVWFQDQSTAELKEAKP